MSPVSIQTVEELVAAVPHMLGFEVEESVVLVIPGGPYGRLDLPVTAAAREEAAEVLRLNLGKHVPPGQKVSVVAFSDDSVSAMGALNAVGDAFGWENVAGSVMVTGARYTSVHPDLSGVGVVRSETRVRVAGMFAERGSAAPEGSREEMRASLRSESRHELEAAFEAAIGRGEGQRMSALELSAMLAAAKHPSEQRLTDEQVVALVATLHEPGHEFVAAIAVDRHATAARLEAMWIDVVRRTPDAYVARAAEQCSLAAWVNGNGAKAWLAYDLSDPDRMLPVMMHPVLSNGVSPQRWDAARLDLEGLHDQERAATRARTPTNTPKLDPAPPIPPAAPRPTMGI